LIQRLYEVASESGFQEDLRQPVPVPAKRKYKGAPDLRGFERVSMRIGARSFNGDCHTKLVEIAEFNWDALALTPCLEVSWWENTLKTRLLRRIKQQIED